MWMRRRLHLSAEAAHRTQTPHDASECARSSSMADAGRAAAATQEAKGYLHDVLHELRGELALHLRLGLVNVKLVLRERGRWWRRERESLRRVDLWRRAVRERGESRKEEGMRAAAARDGWRTSIVFLDTATCWCEGWTRPMCGGV